MNIKKTVSLILAAAFFSATAAAYAAPDTDGKLFHETYDMSNVKADKKDGVVKEVEVPDGDYTVTVTTGGKTETQANIYINGGERVRAYTLEAGKTQENEQPVVPKDGKISVQVIGENPNVTEIEIEQLPARKEKGEKPTVYIAGDSTAQTYNYETAYPQTGWGQVFADYFTDDVIVENRSMGGRSSKSYNNDGRLDKILTEMHPGDYVFIQFGINDGSDKPERYISVEDYKTLIKEKYMGEVEKRGGIPVLMTASAAGWWDDANNKFKDSRQDYADPTRDLAKETGCVFIDANRFVTDVWNTMDKDDVLSGYFICEQLESKAYPTGTNDTTHLKEKGARRMAKLIADDLEKDVPELYKYVKKDISFTDMEDHWAKEVVTRLANDFIVQGDGNGKFDPDDSVTRAEFLKMAMDACGIVGHAYREDECLDAKQGDWFCYYVQGALDKGIIPVHMIGFGEYRKETETLAEATADAEAVTTEIYKFYSQPTTDAPAPGKPAEYSSAAFNGNEPITREEMAAIMMNCMSYKLKNSDSGDMSGNNYGDAFTDAADIDPSYANAVDAAYANGYINGMGDGTFAPKAELTRAQAAVVVDRLMNQ